MFKLAIISSLVLLSSFNVYAQEKEQIEVWEEPSKSFAITKAIADFEAINDCEIKLREISSAKQLDVLKEHIKNPFSRIPEILLNFLWNSLYLLFYSCSYATRPASFL